jgi:hypothetical protein
MTTNAITSNFKICQSNLGVKIHDAKDRAESLGPMFRQVVHTLFVLMEQHEAEAVVEEQARVFEDYKEYLIKIWDEKRK